MAESDHSEGEDIDKKVVSHLPTESVDTSNKRVRENESEDGDLNLPSKKPRKSLEESSSSYPEDKMRPKSNGDTETIEQQKDLIPIENGKNNTDAIMTKADTKHEAAHNENVQKEESLTKNGEILEEASASKSNNTSTSDNNKVDDKNDVKRDNSGTSLVVDGLELNVECASDKEETTSESEKDNDTKPRPKTIIVKQQPNDSELDMSSSAGEELLVDNVKEETKKEKRKGSKKSLGRRKISDSDDSEASKSDDEDYSPQTKRTMKKLSISKKSTKASPETKKGRNTAKKMRQNTDKEEIVEEDDVKFAEKSHKTLENKEKAQRVSSGTESSVHSSENDSEAESTKDSKHKKRETVKPEDDKKIQALKKYIRAAGITVKSYQDVWVGCKSNAARARKLKELLEKHGVKGRPTLSKCKRAKEANERLKEVSELDTTNIISEGRITRARKNMDINKRIKTTPETPTRHREARNTLKRIRCVIDSDDTD